MLNLRPTQEIYFQPLNRRLDSLIFFFIFSQLKFTLKIARDVQ